MRPEVVELLKLGGLPSDSGEVDDDAWARQERLIVALRDGPPPTVDEVSVLFRLFPREGGSFGLEWSLLHFVEKAEPIAYATAFVECLPETLSVSREWMTVLAVRQLNAEAARALLIAAGMHPSPAARGLLINVLTEIATYPQDVGGRARLALVGLGA